MNYLKSAMAAAALALSLTACGQPPVAPVGPTTYMSAETCNAWVRDWLVRSYPITSTAHPSIALVESMLDESHRIVAHCEVYGYHNAA